MSSVDRALRIGIGVCLVYTAFFASWLIDIPSINLAMGLFGLMNIASAMIGICPGYLLARVSTLRATTPEKMAGKARETSLATEGVTASLRNRLMLCIVLPGVLAAMVFGIVLHRFASDLAILELTANGRAVALLAAKLSESGTSELSGSLNHSAVSTNDQNPDVLRESITALVFHDHTGRLYTHFWQKMPDSSIPIDELLNEVGTDLNTYLPLKRGRWHNAAWDLSWVSEPVTDSNLWVTAIVDTSDYNATLAQLLGPRILALVLIMLWMTLWGAIYNVRKYTQRMANDAKELRHRSLHDPLTGLLNRLGLEEALQRHFKAPASSENQAAFIVIDLIGFRSINDSFGHALADQLLCEVAKRIRIAVPDMSEIVRMGGDTFGILCPGVGNPENAHPQLQRLHETVDTSCPIGSMQLKLASRSGIAFAPLDTDEGTQLVRFADLALSRAKRKRVEHCEYEPDEEMQSVRRLTLISALHLAIKNDELNLVYQPKISVADGSLTGVEALARWTHPNYGPVSPDEFVSLAERSGLIDSLTHWALLSAERQCAAWSSEGLRIPIAVNLSPLNLHDQSLPDLVKQIVSNGSLSGGLLELELTENAVMIDAEFAMERLCTLVDLGVTLSIDDFGSGQSSFAYLQRFPISNLKIDRQFVMSLVDDNGGNDTLLRSMIELGHNMGFLVTAEGVEDEPSLKRLQVLGCNHAQGYYIGRPMPANELRAWLDNHPGIGSKAA